MFSHLVLSIAQHSLQRPFCSLLDGFLNLGISCRLSQTACQVDN